MSPASPRHRRTRLVVGRPEPGPEGIQDAFVEEVRRLKEKDPLRPLAVLVGSNYLRLHLSRLLAIRLGGHANINFHLLGDLARRLGAGPLAARGRREIPELGRDLLLREAVSVHSHGTYFTDIVAREGFAEALGATLRDLKDARIDPSTLRAASASRRHSDPASGKLADLADLYETYDDLLRDRRFYDEEDLMRVATEEAAAADIRSRETAAGPAAPAALVYGFYDATSSQRALIREYLAWKPGAVFFPRDADDPDRSWDYAQPMLEWLASWIPERIDRDAAPPPAPRRDPGPEVTFLSAPGEAREALEAVRWLVAQARERSVPFGEMALLYRSPESYRDIVPELMDQAGGVPRFLSDGRKLSSTPAARALALVLKLRDEDLPRRGVIELLALGRAGGDAPVWDRISRQAGVASGIADWRRRLDRMAARVRGGSDAPHVEDLRRQVETLHAAIRRIPAEAPWVTFAEGFSELLHRFGPDDPSAGEVETRLLDLGALDEVSSPATFRQFSLTLTRSIDRALTRRPEESSFQRSGIFVGSVMDARLLSFHATAILGLVEKSFPAPSRQDPILLDEERQAVNALVGEARLPLKGRRLDEERLLFRLARATTGGSLLVGYPRLDAATARPRIPSPFLLRLARTLEGRHVDYETLETLPRMRRVSLASQAPAEPRAALFPREFLLRALASAAATGADAAERRRVATFLHSNPILHRALGAEAARWAETRFTAHDGVVLRPSLVEALRAHHAGAQAAISASRIEEYARCPLAYFMKHVLGLEPLDEPEDEDRIDPMRRGRIVHGILFDVFTDLRERGLLPIGPDRLETALSLLGEAAARHFAREEADGIPGYPLLWEIDKERIRSDLAEFLAREASGADEDWEPAHFETRFGMERRLGEEAAGEDPASTAEPALLEIGAGRLIRLKGRIDRIEISRDGRRARITDYKSGKLDRYKPDQLRGGTTVQLPFYMLAARRILSARKPAPEPSEARYLSVESRGEFKSVSFSAEALKRRAADLAKVAATFATGVERGVFFAYPEADVCSHCDFKLACGEGREARFARKRADATASDFLKMREEIP